MNIEPRNMYNLLNHQLLSHKLKLIVAMKQKLFRDHGVQYVQLVGDMYESMSALSQE